MGLYQSTFLLVCEGLPEVLSPKPGKRRYWIHGCGRELLIEQVRGVPGARERAAQEGWVCQPPGHYDATDQDTVLCPTCNAEREQSGADWLARQGAAR